MYNVKYVECECASASAYAECTCIVAQYKFQAGQETEGLGVEWNCLSGLNGHRHVDAGGLGLWRMKHTNT